MKPIVLIVSHCPTTSALDVISNIRKLSKEEEVEEIDGDCFYNHDIKTKYYTTQIACLPVESLDNLSETVKCNVEGFLIYFDPNDRKFLEKLPEYVEFIKERQIEFCMMLCGNELQDDVKNGITFSCIKNCYNLLDIIELGRETADDDEDADPFNPSGYDELAQALRSVIWSNVDINEAKETTKPSTNGTSSSNEDLNDAEVDDDELDMFEDLLNKVSQFRPATSGMSREDRLNHAENMAEMFERLIMQDEDLSQLSDIK